MAKERCAFCSGEHEPCPADASVMFNGKKYTYPFHCLCCGREVCMQQFGYGRTCGPCDMGACDPQNKSFDKKYAHAPLELKENISSN